MPPPAEQQSQKLAAFGSPDGPIAGLIHVFGSVAIAVVARAILSRTLHSEAPFITLLPAVVYSAWVAGFSGGLLATLLASLIACFILSPSDPWALAAGDWRQVGRFALVGVVIAGIGGAQLRTRARANRLAKREHEIASRLQDALQPSLPETLPGMSIAGYYRAALDEAEIGGDFCDAFSLDKTITFLVVGDLSGKGLAAAVEVATIRNMLRYALYNGRTLSGPVERLNLTLAEHGLISGFATLFVGRYDASARMLTYVNCGQEAALVLRAKTGQIDELGATGPVMGMAAGGKYEEKIVTVEAGDVLSVFTDGLTESGPSRKQLLDIEGLKVLLSRIGPQEDPHAMVGGLISGIADFGGDEIRDDQCLLVATFR